jgi:gluconokinase
MNTPPRSAYDKTGGMMYFARMLDKIRLFAKGELRPDFHTNLGKGADNWCLDFLRVDYDALRERVLAKGTDEEILAWCFEHGRALNDTDFLVWNSFVAKLGWNDLAAPRLRKYKEASGLGDRNDIQTMLEYFEVDEGRKP